ncbi:acyl-CoA thioesterase [Candidatus Jorgensenbacteria bacterium]|nr:acyl-CoA thioesterase [Candidatus Jorgensenbacteria bacterium]
MNDGIMPVSFSAVDNLPYMLMPGDLNSNNTVFGGRVMEIADRLAGTVAMRHSGKTCVTLLVDSMKFLAPARQGEVLVFKAAVNRTWNSSLEIGVKVYAEDLKENTRRHVVSAYFTFVALDDQCKPIHIRQVVAETAEEKRRYKEADVRRMRRLEH